MHGGKYPWENIRVQGGKYPWQLFSAKIWDVSPAIPIFPMGLLQSPLRSAELALSSAPMPSLLLFASLKYFQAVMSWGSRSVAELKGCRGKRPLEIGIYQSQLRISKKWRFFPRLWGNTCCFSLCLDSICGEEVLVQT